MPMSSPSPKTVTWLVGGPAGYGVNSSGEMFARCFTRGGLNVLAYLEYPSLIRGGHNSYHIRVSEGEVTSHIEDVHLLACLNKETFEQHKSQVPEGGAILYDPNSFSIEDSDCPMNVTLYSVPFAQIVKDHEGIDVMRNTVALGASLAILDYPFSYLEELIAEQFKSKSDKVIELNVAVAKAGYEYIQEAHSATPFGHTIQPTERPPQILLSGNAALAYGAMQAGCKLYSAYPMTPASSILTVFARHEEEMNIVVKQPEDELAAVLYAVGSNFAGVRSMAATSGGGFALMNEALSLAGIAEVPLVVIESQRPGPGTGLPTWTGQSDLQYVLHAGHDEFPRMVVAPGDIKEAYRLIQEAFNIAERYHMPVIVMSEKYISESLFSVESFDDCIVPIDRGPLATPEELAARADVKEDYPRYKITDSGISKRVIPGMPNARYVANSNEHDEVGDIDEGAENRTAMHAKRMRKLETLAAELPEPEVYGPADADVSLVGWGSTKGMALEAIELLKALGVSANYLHTQYLWPFPAEFVKTFLKKAKRPVLLELNHNGQFGQLIRQETLIDIPDKFLKWDGRPFTPRQIVEHVQSLLNA
jgi:2-oxoglutarate ferredoxin oxidoreductase subunit alpha